MFKVCAFYKFTQLDNLATIKDTLLVKMRSLEIYGTVLLAQEGINGTISGTEAAIKNIINYIENTISGDIDYKFANSQNKPFKRLKVKLKKEIVTMGVTGINPEKVVGTFVDVKDWNKLISSDDVILVDTRNDYEYEIGSFKGAINPATESFREFPKWSEAKLTKYRHKKIAMFCTGGIRCEKSTAYLKSQGFNEVYHLRGGILKYLEQVDEADSLWQGECFVFDDRVSVSHNLIQGTYDQCYACRYPIDDNDKQHKHYQKGVSCPRCYGSKTKAQLSSYQERELQVNLAAARGEQHIGDVASRFMLDKKILKKTNVK